MEITLRTKENDLDLIKKYLEKSKIKTCKILVSREYGTENGKEHFHYYIEVTHGNQKEESILRGIRRCLFNKYKKVDYYVKKVKDRNKLLVYITKDGDIVNKENFTEDELMELQQQNEIIEKDKQLPVYQKLYNKRW